LVREAVEVRRIFRFETDLGRSGWRIVGAGYEKLAAGGYVQRRDFPYYSVEFFAAGRGLVELGGARRTLASGCVYATAPDDRLGLRADPQRVLHRYYLWLDGPGAGTALKNVGVSAGRMRFLESPGDIREAWGWLLRDGERTGEAGRALAQGLAEVLLLKLAISGDVEPFRLKSSERASFERCRALADEQVERIRNVADLAAAAGLRTETICRQFRRYLATTPGDYLRASRMRLASERLRVPGVRIKEVAASLGFSDAFHFSRVFKRETGVSPKTWVSRQS
jgi:AraC-like DNA-binding protein